MDTILTGKQSAKLASYFSQFTSLLTQMYFHLHFPKNFMHKFLKKKGPVQVEQVEDLVQIIITAMKVWMAKTFSQFSFSEYKQKPTRRHLATLQPRVPEPSSRQLVLATASRSSSGRSRQRISFRLRSTADSANLGQMYRHQLQVLFYEAS